MEKHNSHTLFETETAYKCLSERRKQLTLLLEEKRKSIKEAPEGHLHVVKNGKNHTRVQYYHRKKSSEKSGTYIRKSEQETAVLLAQKDYDLLVAECAERELKEIESFLNRVNFKDLSRQFDFLIPERQRLVLPIIKPDEQFLVEWQNARISEDFHEEEKNILTRRQEKVRSKSEALIANMLDDFHVPYKYEQPLFFHGRKIAVPDFTVLNVAHRKEFYWEHFGMMDHQNYANKALEKIIKLSNSDIILGKNLIASFESSTEPINLANIEALIRAFLIN